MECEYIYPDGKEERSHFTLREPEKNCLAGKEGRVSASGIREKDMKVPFTELQPDYALENSEVIRFMWVQLYGE